MADPTSHSNTDSNSNGNTNGHSYHDKYRSILPAAKEIKGRCIAQILYDRSIHGPNGINAQCRLLHSQQYYSQRHAAVNPTATASTHCGYYSNKQHNDSTGNLSNASPSSVINEDSSGDSLSEVLNNNYSEDQTSMTAITIQTKQAHDSLAEVLDDDENEKPNGEELPIPISIPTPSRLTIKSYPHRYFTEIRNYSELYSVTKFHWNYLSLKTRQELLNQNRRNGSRNSQSRHGRRRRRNGNNHDQQHGNQHHRHPNHNNHDSDSISDSSSSNEDDHQTDTDTAISTISIAFSPDGRTIASTHGDHTVKITCCHTGSLIRNLEGHPRTPWTVKYHPTKSNIVASGCLGFQVRVWDWNYVGQSTTTTNNNHNNNSNINQHPLNNNNTTTTNNNYYHTDVDDDNNELNYHKRKCVCLNMVRLDSAIISLSFHPTGTLLAVASGKSLHLWVYDDNAKKEYQQNQQQQLLLNDNVSSVQDDQQQQQRQQNNPNRDNTTTGSSIITQITYEHTLRCVHFPPDGDTIILGGVNPPQGETSYSLRLWDFDLEVALNPRQFLGQQQQQQQQQQSIRSIRRRDALTNFRTFVPRALLYNDGGFDVSPDGKMLCGCAEILLPDGVDSAVDFVEKTTWKCDNYDDDILRSASTSTNTNDNNAHATNSDNTRMKGTMVPNNIRSPRRKLSRPLCDKEEKRRKEVADGQIVDASSSEESNDEALSPLERPQLANNAGDCQTPPNPIRPQVLTSPPSPPGRRWPLSFSRTNRVPIPLRVGRQNQFHNPTSHDNSDGPPAPPSHHPYQRSGIRLGVPSGQESGKRYVPHAVVVNLDKSRGELGQLLEVTPLGSRASSVTCVKFSPSAEFCLLGYGVREHAAQPPGQKHHPVTALYRIRGGLKHVATMNSSDDDVNIARFHPHSGQGFVYGTKQGRVRVLSPRPWNQYYEY